MVQSLIAKKPSLDKIKSLHLQPYILLLSLLLLLVKMLNYYYYYLLLLLLLLLLIFKFQKVNTDKQEKKVATKVTSANGEIGT